MTTWNDGLIIGGGAEFMLPNYVNSDEGNMIDKGRPRDGYGFRLFPGRQMGKLDFFQTFQGILDTLTVERYLDTSGSGLSYQEIPFDEDEVGTNIIKMGSSIILDDDGYVGIGSTGIYLINVQAQNVRDGEFVVARLFEGPVGWYIKRAGEEEQRENKPHMNLAVSSLSFIIPLVKNDTIVPLCGTKGGVGLNGTFVFSVTRLR